MAKKKKEDINKPSKEDAELALAAIKELQKKNDEDEIKKKAEDEERRKMEALMEMERIQKQIVEEKIRRKLRENLAKKAGLEKKEFIKKEMESGKNIRWQYLDNGHKLQGYVKDKMIFEIKRGLSLFTLYIKNEEIIKKHKLKAYFGCSTDVRKLKFKSEKLVKLINLAR